MKVKYQGKIYKVLANKYLGDFALYKLQSHFSGGSPFGAKKNECESCSSM